MTYRWRKLSVLLDLSSVHCCLVLVWLLVLPWFSNILKRHYNLQDYIKDKETVLIGKKRTQRYLWGNRWRKQAVIVVSLFIFILSCVFCRLFWWWWVCDYNDLTGLPKYTTWWWLSKRREPDNWCFLCLFSQVFPIVLRGRGLRRWGFSSCHNYLT